MRNATAPFVSNTGVIRRGCTSMGSPGPVNDLGPAIIRLRHRAGLTQDQVAAQAQCAGVDLTRQILANIEARRCRVTDRQIIVLAEILGCAVEDLFLERSRPPVGPPIPPEM